MFLKLKPEDSIMLEEFTFEKKCAKKLRKTEKEIVKYEQFLF